VIAIKRGPYLIAMFTQDSSKQSMKLQQEESRLRIQTRALSFGWFCTCVITTLPLKELRFRKPYKS